MSLDDMSPAKVVGVLFGGCLAILLLVVLGTLFNGVALMFLWGWFMVVPFGLPALSLGQAIGLSTIVSFITYQYVDSDKKDEETSAKLLRLVAIMIGRPLVTLIFGRIVYFFTYGQ